MACHHARSSSGPLTGVGRRRPLNSSGTAHHWLGFRGSHSRPKEGRVLPPGRIERSQARRGQREDTSGGATPRLEVCENCAPKRHRAGRPMVLQSLVPGQDLPKVQGRGCVPRTHPTSSGMPFSPLPPRCAGVQGTSQHSREGAESQRLGKWQPRPALHCKNGPVPHSTPCEKQGDKAPISHTELL